MKIDTAITPTEPDASDASSSPLVAQAMRAFRPMVADLRELDRVLDTLAEVGGRPVAGTTRKIKRRLWRETPSVTMIGQVKAGKTTLVNAMIGMPDLLPADINPWTSVVTSVHLSRKAPADSARAVFRFFDQNQWDRLIYKGGRIGELAGRAGANTEAAKIADQLSAMRDKSMRRLGNKFELLMGQEHRYGYVDAELVQRYVCLGDDFENDFDTSKTRGRFADITQSADLLIHQPEAPTGLCIRDTPGVNDTFLMREQVTIRAIRESRTCVVVLSAHQAMSTVDMALLRIIASIPSRNLLIFVNRIDELPEPGKHVAEIEQSIRQTLRDHRGPADAQILFGSAYWACHALANTLGTMSSQSAEALRDWETTHRQDGEPGQDGAIGQEQAWALSGIPALYSALADRIARSYGAEITDAVARAAWNLASTLETANRAPELKQKSGQVISIGRIAVPAELDKLEETVTQNLEADFRAIVEEFHNRIDRANGSFIDRAVASLVKHLERSTGDLSWKYDPSGLRMLLRTAFTVFRKRAYAATEEAYFEAAAGISDLYVRSFDLETGSFALEPPALPSIGMPVFLGETIALDLETSWWSRWWKRRRGYRAYREDFAKLVSAETASLVEALKGEYGDRDLERARHTLSDFIDDQRKALLDLWIRKDLSIDDVKLQLIRDDANTKVRTLAEAKQRLQRHLTTRREDT